MNSLFVCGARFTPLDQSEHRRAAEAGKQNSQQPGSFLLAVASSTGKKVFSTVL